MLHSGLLHPCRCHMTSGPEIEPGPHWWEASALSTAPPLLLSPPPPPAPPPVSPLSPRLKGSALDQQLYLEKIKQNKKTHLIQKHWQQFKSSKIWEREGGGGGGGGGALNRGYMMRCSESRQKAVTPISLLEPKTITSQDTYNTRTRAHSSAAKQSVQKTPQTDLPQKSKALWLTSFTATTLQIMPRMRIKNSINNYRV